MLIINGRWSLWATTESFQFFWYESVLKRKNSKSKSTPQIAIQNHKQDSDHPNAVSIFLILLTFYYIATQNETEWLIEHLIILILICILINIHLCHCYHHDHCHNQYWMFIDQVWHSFILSFVLSRKDTCQWSTWVRVPVLPSHRPKWAGVSLM